MSDNPIEKIRARLDGGNKWMKGRFDGPDGQACIARACGDVLNTPRVYLEARAAIEPVVREQYPDRMFFQDGSPCISAIPHFNDHEDTTWADVELVLDKASLRWEETVQ